MEAKGNNFKIQIGHFPYKRNTIQVAISEPYLACTKDNKTTLGHSALLLHEMTKKKKGLRNFLKVTIKVLRPIKNMRFNQKIKECFSFSTSYQYINRSSE